MVRGIRSRNYGRRRGFQGRLNFGVAKLERSLELQHRIESVGELAGQDALEALFLFPEATPKELLADTSYMSLLEKILWCGEAKRLLLLEYINAEGVMAIRHVEYYSFRRVLSSGNMLMFGWSHREPPGGIRSYRLDRIISVYTTLIPYVPQWEVELYNV